ncbi:DNA repair protein RecN [Robiginitomaculum antarcticum]|uniref:DNA repair protein RecN n=1 Tax=Robiginitomaculum antarcticum TaxID=437507 RepID=UPI00035D5F90|nr:DNA repair protein RecN [Robiginitomaculum antarcticum]
MLRGLSIRDVVLIQALDMSLSGGLTALTGETGAGKSIILDSLGMATGARSDKGLIRTGSNKAQVTASFDVPASHMARRLIEDADVDAPLGEDILLRRVIGEDGRSRAFINDQPVSVSLLSAVGNALLEVHGQHDGRGLLDPRTHISLLDRFGGYKSVLQNVSSAYAAKKAAQDRLDALMSTQQQASDDREFFEAGIAEIDRLAPKPDEDEGLADRRRFLQNAQGALTELTAAQDAMGEDGEYEDRLAAALRGLERVQSRIGAGDSQVHLNLTKAVDALEKALIETGEARAAVSEASYGFDIDPNELNDVEERLFSLRAAARKFNTTINGLIDIRAKFAQDLFDIDNADEAIAQAKSSLSRAAAEYDTSARDLTMKRKNASKKLDAAVKAELGPLKMGGARFETDLQPARDSATGRDKVGFVVATNPGSALGALDKVASGGELSRFALAIKVALAGDGDLTLIFDEVDAGVGGAVADAVGQRLAHLSGAAQVLVVTHSPQVAAKANQQLLISKSIIGDRTHTQVTPVSGETRLEEIARMLSGASVNDAAREAAKQLIGTQGG